MRARVSLISSAGSRVDRDLDAFLTPALRERARDDANQFIKRLRLVPYGTETMRTRFTYRGDSLWWFTELYLHKMRRIDTALSVVHALDAAWRPGIQLNSKTGASTIESGESVSWLVGQLMVDERKLTFASATWRSKGGVDTLDATRLAIRTFVDRGVLAKRAR